MFDSCLVLHSDLPLYGCVCVRVCMNAFICKCVAHPLLAGITDLVAAAEDFRNAQLSTASTSQIGASLDEAEYVRLLEIQLAVRKLASQGFSWKDCRGTSPTAQLLQGSTHKEQTQLPTKILACEIKLKVSWLLPESLHLLITARMRALPERDPFYDYTKEKGCDVLQMEMPCISYRCVFADPTRTAVASRLRRLRQRLQSALWATHFHLSF